MGFLRTSIASAAAVAAFAAGSVAHAEAAAGFFVEPGVTYDFGSKTEIDYPVVDDNSSGTANGFGIVGRAGLHVNEMFFVAADGRYGKPRFTDSTNDLKADATSWSLAPVVGLQMPDLGVRVWAGYVAASQFNPEETKGVDFKFKEGTGYLVGAGFRVSAVSINLEYKDVKYASTEVESLVGLDTNIFSNDTKFSDRAFIGSVTFPLEL